jgi:hypothetical protein
MPPARVPRPSPPAASSPPLLAGPVASPTLPRAAPPLDGTSPRVADAAANRGTKPTLGEPIDPRARCGERNFFSMLVCIKRECGDPAVSAHAECVKLREQEAAGRARAER